MIGWENRHKKHQQASKVKKQFLIKSKSLQEKRPSKLGRKWRPLRSVSALCSIAIWLWLAYISHAVPAEVKYPIGSVEFDYSTRQSRFFPGPATTWKRSDTLRGEIRLYATNPTLGTLWCKGEFQDVAIYDVVGEDSLHGIHNERLSSPDMDFRVDGATFKYNVKIKGRMWWKPNELQCSDETINIRFKFSNPLDFKGMRVYRADGIVFKKEPLETPSDSSDGTIGFISATATGVYESETIEFQRFDGITFERSRTFGDTQFKERLILHVPHPDYPDLTKPLLRYESPPPDPTRVKRARIGPPLSQVPYGIPTKK